MLKSRKLKQDMFCCVATNHGGLFHGYFMASPEIKYTYTYTHARSLQGQSKDEFNFPLTSNAEHTPVHVTLNLFTVAHIQTRCHTRFQLFNFWLFSVQQNKTKINVKTAVATHI